MSEHSPLRGRPTARPVLNYALPHYPKESEEPAASKLAKRLANWTIVDWAIVLGIICLVVAILLPGLPHSHPPANKTKCLAQLRTVGQLILQYAADHKGRFPDDLGELFTAYPTTNIQNFLICPASADTPASGTTAQQRAAALMSQPGHSSYVYFGKGLKTKTPSPSTTIILYETSSHKRYVNVAYADGHVASLPPAQAKTVISKLQAEMNSPSATSP